MSVYYTQKDSIMSTQNVVSTRCKLFFSSVPTRKVENHLPVWKVVCNGPPSCSFMFFFELEK